VYYCTPITIACQVFLGYTYFLIARYPQIAEAMASKNIATPSTNTVSLKNRLKVLSMPVELWKSIFDWTAVFLAAGAFVAGAGALITGNILNERQDAQLKQFDKDLTGAKSALAAQQERASIADGKLEGLAHDTATAKTEMAKQQTRAATAEQNLLELKERIKPRRLTDKQSQDFVAILKKLPNAELKAGWTAGGGDEGFKFLQQLLPLFVQAHWKVPATTTQVSHHFDIQITGAALLIPGPEGTDLTKPGPAVLIRLNPVQTTLQEAFRAVGIDLEFQRWVHTEDGLTELVIGSKPNP
jgi:hypothetical protein